MRIQDSRVLIVVPPHSILSTVKEPQGSHGAWRGIVREGNKIRMVLGCPDGEGFVGHYKAFTLENEK